MICRNSKQAHATPRASPTNRHLMADVIGVRYDKLIRDKDGVLEEVDSVLR